MALLQIRTTPLGQGLPRPATLLFNCPVCGIMPVMDREPINVDNDDEHHNILMHRQGKNDQNNDTSKIFMSYPHRVNYSGSMRRCRTMDPWCNNRQGQSQ